MKIVGTVLALSLALSVAPVVSPDIEGRITDQPLNIAVTCFKTGEQISGMNKICYYNCLGSAAAITISSVQLCPLSIQQ
jgi:hypothetical protein